MSAVTTHAALVDELRSAAATLRSSAGSNTPTTDRIAAELLERAADALATAYTPAQVAASFRAGLNTARMEEDDTHGRPMIEAQEGEANG